MRASVGGLEEVRQREGDHPFRKRDGVDGQNSNTGREKVTGSSDRTPFRTVDVVAARLRYSKKFMDISFHVRLDPGFSTKMIVPDQNEE